MATARRIASKTASAPRGRSTGAEAYNLILKEIEDGELPPGIRLREEELADRLGLSRTPVREALKRLELQGLVVHEPHHGAIVASLDYAQVTELYLMREILEGTAARLAAQHATAVEVDLLNAMVERDRGLTDPKKLAQTNRKFHQQICDIGKNRFLSMAVENLRMSVALLAGTTLRAPNRAIQSVEEHAAIVKCIADREPDGAESAARKHIRNSFYVRIQMHSNSLT